MQWAVEYVANFLLTCMVVVKIVQLKLQDTHISDLPRTLTFNFSYKGSDETL